MTAGARMISSLTQREEVHLPQRAAVASKQTTHSERSTENNSCDRTAVYGVPEESIEHLHPVPLRAAADETIRVVCARELLALWEWHLEELAQRLPALAHLIFEEVLWWYERPDLLVVLLESALAVLLEVAFPEIVPEF